MASKRMSPKKRSSKRKSVKKTLSPKMMSWTKKLAMWRKNHMRADGSLPSLKAAMKACKGRRVSSKKCRRRKSFRKHRKSPKAMTGAGRVEYHRYANADKYWKKKKSSKKTSKRKSPKRKSPKRKSPKRKSPKRTSKKKTSNKRASTKKTSCTNMPSLTGNSGGGDYTLKSGQKYRMAVYGLDVTNDADYEKVINNFVYNPSTFKQRMEKVLCSWTKGNKVTVTKFNLDDMNDYKDATVSIIWK